MFKGRILTILKQTSLSSVHKNAKINIFPLSSLNIQIGRPLYSKAALGLEGFEYSRQLTQKQMENIADSFKEKMSEYIQEDTKHMVFTEDLKNMIHISSSEKDLELVVRMIKKFNKQNKELRFGTFIFGPVVMRLFHQCNQPDLALECFKSTELDGFFDQVISYQILLDLLYENQRYNEVLECVSFIKQKQLEGPRYPKNVVVLAMAACYKLNTKESLDYALNLWQELKDQGHFPMRRATTFCAGLAYNQGQPGIALEILSSSKNQNYTTVRNLKIAALVAIGRVENAIPILRSILGNDVPENQTHTFNRNIVEKVKEAITKLDNPEIALEFNRIEQILQKQGQIIDTDIDEQLCQEMKMNTMENFRRDDNFKYAKTYNRNYDRTNDRNDGHRRIFRKKFSRPGLDDLV